MPWRIADTVAMLRFQNKGRLPPQLSAFEFSEGGISFARVTRPPGAPPVLHDSGFHPVDTAADRSKALAELVRGRGRRFTGPCTLLMDSSAYSLLLIEAPAVPAEELRAAVRWRIRELIDFHVDDAVIDVFDLPAQKAAGRPSMMYVVAARVPKVGEKIELARRSGLAVHIVDIPELAQRNIASVLPEDVAGVALLSLCDSSSLISLTRQSSLFFARRLDVGLHALSQVDPSHWHAGDDFVRAWLDTVIVEIQRSLDYYESSFAQSPISNLVFAPMAPPIGGLAEYVSQQLGLSARILELESLIDVDSDQAGPIDARCLGAIGAALRVEEPSL